MTIHVHMGDLPEGIDFGKCVAIDSETLGLNPHRDRLCVVQLSSGDGDAHLVHFAEPDYSAPNLKAMLSDPNIEKLFHFARFDVAVLYHYLGVKCSPIYCTKIVSKMVRTYTDKHGLKALCQELLHVDLSKQQQSSDWGSKKLSPEQIEYAASDVLYLHKIREILDGMLEREGRTHMAKACFEFLPTRCELDLGGWPEVDIFSH